MTEAVPFKPKNPLPYLVLLPVTLRYAASAKLVTICTIAATTFWTLQMPASLKKSRIYWCTANCLTSLNLKPIKTS